MDGVRKKAAESRMNAIARSESAGLARLLGACGIRQVGAKAGKVLAQDFGTLDELMAATGEELQSIPDIGAVTALALKRAAPDPRLVLFLKAGVCGGFTTFSSFALETGDLLKSGHTAAALLYAAASLVLGVAAVFAGEAAVR